MSTQTEGTSLVLYLHWDFLLVGASHQEGFLTRFLKVPPPFGLSLVSLHIIIPNETIKKNPSAFFRGYLNVLWLATPTEQHLT